ncbi:hypothetical protein D9758_003088 [Tetrapyrgos nigripes]|uniref:Uncharacterized protein n=1 Tax=Tetrapyrgos nigripes TaxID=182062 RepID=A0A8H5LT01_9AGAR|nr:hypothetical protein D9758_003088 [Tetrapyrgos nigripes]
MQPFPQNPQAFQTNNVPQMPQMLQPMQQARPVQGPSMAGPFNMGNMSMNMNFMGGMGMNPMGAGLGRGLNPSNDDMSIELFKANIQVTLEKVLSVQTVARNTLARIQNAYHPGSNPAQTEANIATLKQDLSALADLMRHSGVGGLPLLLPQLPLPTEPGEQSSASQTPSIVVPSEEQMHKEATNSIEILYEQLKRMRDSAGTVANLLQAPLHAQGIGIGMSSSSGSISGMSKGGASTG